MSHLKLKESYDPHPWKWWHIPLLVILIAGTAYIVLSNKRSADSWQTDEGLVFGTSYHIKYNNSKDLSAGIHQTLTDVDQSLSTFNDSSTISAINTNRSDEMDDRLMEIVTTSQSISSKTHGAFDITVAPLVNAWGFGFKNAENLDSAQIDSILAFVGMDKIHVDGHKLKKDDSRTMLDCNAIAKGYGVDAVGRYLESEGVENYMVEIGGEVRVRGKNDKQSLWRIGINEPVDDSLSVSKDLENIIEVENISMATSGNYRNFYIKDNKKYAHTIDPKTGYPIQHNILSSTVLASDCMTADAYATAFMVCGLDSARAILSHTPSLKGYFIYSKPDGSHGVWHSPGLKLNHQ